MGGPGGKGDVAYHSGHGLGSGHGHMEQVRRRGPAAPPPPPALGAADPRTRPAYGTPANEDWARWRQHDWEAEPGPPRSWDQQPGRSTAAGSGDAWAPADWDSSPPQEATYTQSEMEAVVRRAVQDAMWTWRR